MPCRRGSLRSYSSMSSVKGSITLGGWATFARVGGNAEALSSRYFFGAVVAPGFSRNCREAGAGIFQFPEVS